MEALERLVFLDTETTGLDPRLGHRIIEVAAIEAVDRHVTGRAVHFYVDPEREIDAGATGVHGFTWDDLRGKPKFSAIVEPLMTFLSGARVIIHNAPFDVSFLDHELLRLRQRAICRRDFLIDDSLTLARQKYPGKRNSLDALCDRLGVDNSQRNLHGALLDARLLADVYFALTREQASFEMAITPPRQSPVFDEVVKSNSNESLTLTSIDVPDESMDAHRRYALTLGEEVGRSRDW